MNRIAPSSDLAAHAYPADGLKQTDPTSAGTVTPILLEYLEIARRRKWVIAGVMLAFLMIALVVTLLMRPVYSATTQIEVSRDQKSATNMQGVEAEAASRDLEFYQTQYSLLEARSLAERVMRNMRLASNENFWDAHSIDPKSIAEASGEATPGVDLRRTSAVREKVVIETLLENVSIEPIRGSSLINITYSSYDPEISAQIANTWAREFVEQSIARKFSSTAEARDFLEGRLEELRQRLEASERALVDYATTRNIVTLDSGGGGSGGASAQIRERTLAADSLEALNTELASATAARIEAQSRAEMAGTVQSNETLARLREQRARSASELANLLVQFEPEYPTAAALQGQVNELDRAIAREVRRIADEQSQSYKAAASREAQLRARVNALSGEVLDQRSDAIQYNIIQREADTNRQLYDSLLQRYKEIGVAGVSANNITLIDEAQPPQDPSSPNLLLNLLLSLLGGALVSVAIVFLLEQSREGLNDPTKVGALLGLPLLGSVPKATDEEDLVALLNDPKTEFSEAYFSIRSALAFTTSHGVPKSMMTTSTQPAEGKSLSALALATVLARVNRRVILIDCDLRNPSAHALLRTDRDVGVSNFLAGEEDISTLIKQISENLDFMPAGPSVPSAAELFSTDRFENLVRKLEQEYDHVIVDSAPVIGLADAPLIGRVVQAVVYIVEAGGVSVRGINAALDRLRSANAPLIGVIVTKLDKDTSAYGYGYDYSYKYHSENDAKHA
jgi:polysaccharide biosynthesis transport protein